MGDISVAGRVTTSVAKIPCTVLELQDFLDNNSLAILWNYMVSMRILDILLSNFLQCSMILIKLPSLDAFGEAGFQDGHSQSALRISTR